MHDFRGTVQVDATEDNSKDLAEKFGVSGYPTLKIFKNRDFLKDFQGERQWKDIAAYMRVSPHVLRVTYTRCSNTYHQQVLMVTLLCGYCPDTYYSQTLMVTSLGDGILTPIIQRP